VFARYWLHNGMLNLEGRKMSKSLGNVTLVHELLQQHPPEALRLALMSAHYRQPLDWSTALIEQSVRTLDRLYGALRELEDVAVQGTPAIPAPVEEALCDDLNTPRALAELATLVRDANNAAGDDARRSAKAALLGAGRALGLLQQDPEAWFKRASQGAQAVDPVEVESLLAERAEARASRDFGRADAIRERLTAMGVVIEDSAQGARWRLAS
jgi:cysteinyl-tRNA synthetase